MENSSSPGISCWPSTTAMRTILPDTSGVMSTFWAAIKALSVVT